MLVKFGFGSSPIPRPTGLLVLVMLPSWEVPPAFGGDFDDFADAGFNDGDEDRDPALIPPPTHEEGAQGLPLIHT